MKRAIRPAIEPKNQNLRENKMQNGKEVAVMGQGAMDLVGQGEIMSQTQVGYQTAVYVQRARDIDMVVKAVEREAQYAAESAYYSWKVKDKKSGRMVTVEGLSIGGEMAIAREWGNCAIPVEIQETHDAYIFTASFVDLEKGFTVTRVFKQTKTAAVGKYDDARWADMQLQIGQSKAIRNAVKAGVPAWLQERALKLAKQAVVEGISKEGLQVAIDKAIKFLAGHSITEAQMVVTMGNSINSWTAQDVATLRGMCQQINDGTERAETLFGIKDAQTSDIGDKILNKTTGEIKTDNPPDKPKEAPEKKEEKEKVQKPKKNAKKKEEIQEDPAEPERYLEYVAAYKKLNTVLDCNRWMLNNRDEAMEAMSIDYFKKFIAETNKHLEFLKEVAERESKESAE